VHASVERVRSRTDSLRQAFGALETDTSVSGTTRREFG
jgi:hypothetical protein